nr:uncharacterized protein LOC111844905 [Paramormyrops kingsleyae]
MTRNVQNLLKERNSAFRSGDGAQYSADRANLKWGIKEVKAAYSKRIEDQLSSNNTRPVWRGLQHVTGYKSSNLSAAEGEASLAEELNFFFARFDVYSKEDPLYPLTGNGNTLTLEDCDVRRTVRAVNMRKAPGPDGVTGRVLKDCADQLAAVFTNIFNHALSQSTVPPCLKSSVIVPLPKKPRITSLNDYRPVALTPIVMKCSEKLVRSHIIAGPPPVMDKYRFT